MENNIYCINACNEREVFPMLNKTPNQCPCCSCGIQPIHVSSFFYTQNRSPKLNDIAETWHLYVCPQCEKFFGKSVSARLVGGSGGRYFEELDMCAALYPYSNHNRTFSEQIGNLSPSFVRIYNQAETAESRGLNEICGVGYRKALEFLVKDYLCHNDPDKTEAIKSEFLGKSLKRIDSTRVQTLAERATWIGNDETHYVRTHENLDVSKMKAFINAMVSFIDDDLTFQAALEIQGK